MASVEQEVMARSYRDDWSRAVLAVGVVAVLFGLAIANAVVLSNWTEVEDGVLWADRREGVIAVDISVNSSAARAGLKLGDVLLSINGESVSKGSDVLQVLHAGDVGTRLDYAVLRMGNSQIYELSLELTPSVAFPVYLVLAFVGLFGLIVGAAVRVRRPGHKSTLHFFWLTVAFFGVFAFSYSGRLDRLDWIFFWADEVSILLLAPLFLHFTLVFPDRSSGWLRERLSSWLLPLIYFPALALGFAQVATVSGVTELSGFIADVEQVWRLQHFYLAVCAIGGLVTMVVAVRRVRSVTARRQLWWIVSGVALGGLPFVVGYALPYALEFSPLSGFELTAVTLGLIPLAFASAIVHYRLRDVEVIVKRSLVYTTVAVLMVAIYFVLEELWFVVLLDDSDEHNSIIALLTTAVILLLASPVKKTIQTMLDRVYYRDRFDYRRALVRFARDLNTDLDLKRLSERLVSRVAQTLVVERMVLLLDRELSSHEKSTQSGLFLPIKWVGLEGEPPALSRNSSIGNRLSSRHLVLLDDPNTRRLYDTADVSVWRDRGLYYFVPCISENTTIAVMAVGRKGNGEPLSTEDMALLAAVAGQIATALENGRLYGELQQKARELERMRQFSENIVESFSEGLVVIGLDECVVRWNAGLERLYGVPRKEAIGERFDSLFSEEFTSRLKKARFDTAEPVELYRVPLMSKHTERKRLLVNAATVPLKTPDGEKTGTMLIIEDITSRIQLEEQLQMSEKMASVGLLAAGVAHEINTPLTGISSFTQMLLKGADPRDPKTSVLEKIESQTFRAAKIVNGLLNLARPGSSETTSSVDVNSVINEVLTLLDHQFKERRVKISRALSLNPPIVHAVEFKIQQVLLNLCLNALDAMPTGGCLTVTSRVVETDALIEVSDTGAGIPEEHLSRIYDPFFTTKAQGQGTGLGLSITYGVIQEHAGTIECESRLGHGTRFRITLPLALRRRFRTRSISSMHTEVKEINAN